MYKNLIYIEEYDIYQYFDGEKSIFSHDYPGKAADFEIPAALAVISKNINFSVIPKNGVKSVKKSGLNKYLAKYYKDESYFYIGNAYNEYGVYHTPPLNIKKYYSLLKGIDFIIPYDYLAILFLNEKSIISEEKESFIFIEKAEDIYKIMVVLNGFNLFPVASFKEDMLNDNLNILKTKLNSKNIKINKIITNYGGTDFNIFFGGAGIINFAAKDFAAFFDNIKRTVPHFENLEIKFKNIELRKNKLINLYITALIIAVLFMQSTALFFNNKSYAENQKIKLLNKSTAVLLEQNQKKENIILFNKYFMPPNVAGYLKRFMRIFPKGVRIENVDIKRFKNNYFIDGTVLVYGGYRKFVENYNLILKKSGPLGPFRISYNIDNFGKPFIKFYGRLK